MGEGNTSFVRHQRGLKRKCLREGVGRPAVSGGTAAEAGARRGCSAEEAAERRRVDAAGCPPIMSVLFWECWEYTIVE